MLVRVRQLFLTDYFLTLNLCGFQGVSDDCQEAEGTVMLAQHLRHSEVTINLNR